MRTSKYSYSTLECIFWASLCTLAFNVLFLQDCGFNSIQVGYILALNNIVAAFAPVIWGYVADYFRSLKYVFLMACATLIISTVLLPITASKSILNIPCPAIIMPIYMAAYSGAYSLLDVWVVRICENSKGRLFYSSIRLWGSIGYATICFLLTYVSDMYGIKSVYYIAFVLGVILIFWAVNQYEAPYNDKEENNKSKISIIPLFKNLQFVILLLYNFIIHLIVFASSNYMPYLMMDIGLNESLYSAISGLRGLTEVPILIFGSRLSKKFGTSTILAISGIIYSIECSLYLFSSNIIHITLLQSIAGVAYGLFLSVSAKRVYDLAPKELGATAQSCMVSFVFLGNIVASLIGGYVIELINTRFLYLITAILQTIATVIYILFNRYYKNI